MIHFSTNSNQGGQSRGICLDTLQGCSKTLYGHSDRIYVNFSMFLIYTQKVIHHFPAHIFPDQTLSGYPLKASYFEYKICHKENNCLPYSSFL